MDTKQNILENLKSADGYVSGQQLCEVLGVSRTAVWKAIGALREAGYAIEGAQNRGYRLLPRGEERVPFNQMEIAFGLTTKWAGRRLVFKQETGSTNSDIFALSDKGAPQGTVVVAGRQTAGKGRRGRLWVSPQDDNIYFSILLRPTYPAEAAPMATLVAAMAVCDALEEEAGRADFDAAQSGSRCMDSCVGAAQSGSRCVGSGVRAPLSRTERVDACKSVFAIKWPNDIVARTPDGAWKKVCGILTEMRLEEREIKDVVIGIGINVNMSRKDFAPELQETAASVALALGRTVDRARLAAAVWNHFEPLYERFAAAQSFAPLRQEYESRLVNRGRQVRVLDPQSPFAGTAEGVDEGGRLLVRPADGGAVRAVDAGEVSVRGVEGYV